MASAPEIRSRLTQSRMMLDPRMLMNQSIPTRQPVQQQQQASPFLARASSMPIAKTQQAPVQQTQRPQFDPQRQGKYEGVFDYLNGNIDGSQIQNQGQWVGGEGGSYQDNFVDTRDHGIFKDAVSMTGRDYGGEDAVGHGPGYQLDYTKLPNNGMTKFGRVDQVYQVKNLDDVLNKNAVEWDDNYGWVTPLKNRAPRFADKFGPMVASLAMGGLMGAALPAGMLTQGVTQGLKAMPGLVNGNFNPIGLATNLAGSYLGGMGVPSWMIQAGKAGAGMLTSNKGN